MSKASSSPTDNSKKLQRLFDGARWSPQPKQVVALARPEFEVGFGGARGGGKTDAGIAWLGYDSNVAELQGLVIRKNATDLEGWLQRARFIHGDNIKITGNPPVIHFQPEVGGSRVNGATYFTGHFKDKSAFSKYIGQNLARILIEELELIPAEEWYEKLLSSCRSTIPGIKAQAFSTFNPGDVGHTWIKRRFGLAGIPRNNVITKDARSGRMRIFVPSRVEDNISLMKNDPAYVRYLEGLPDGLREQWRWGSWDDPVIRGAYFTMELAQMRNNSRYIDLPISPSNAVHTYWDIGNDMTCIIFVQFIGDWIHIIDYYQNDTLGFPFYLSKLQEFRENRGYIYGMHHFPHDMDKAEWGTGRNRKEVLEDLEIDYEIIPRVTSKQEAIDMARHAFSKVKVNAARCGALYDGLLNYRKEWDEEKQTFRKDPVHDWASHPSDAFQALAASNWDTIKPPTANSELRPKKSKEFSKDSRKMNSEEFRDTQDKGRFHYDE